MRRFRYTCPHGHSEAVVRDAEQRNLPVTCWCGYAAQRDMIGENKADQVFDPYWDHNLVDDDHPNGRWVKSRKQKERVKKELGLREVCNPFE